jgi:DMSO/TMAO reductase YedYZ molybdopterin-dependent catalytic subunit
VTPAIVKPLPPEWFDRLDTNAEMRWEGMREHGETVPTERFFVRNHTSTPLIDPATYRLELFGSGLRRPRAFSLDELLALPSRDVTAVLECAGNGRSFFAGQQAEPAPGSTWRMGAVGVARWRGVPLAEVLERAGILPTAVDAMPEGLDPPFVEDGVDYGHVRRPLPIGKALDDVLLAYEMNGEALPPDHGAPLRLVVPGWIGIASVKWVGRIEVADRPLFSPWNTTMYRMSGPSYPPDSPPLTEPGVKSAFELPWGAALPAGRTHLLHGRSWSGAGAIERVDVSADGGATWDGARLELTNGAWTRWSLPWTPRRPGEHELLARATDVAGRSQPDAVPFNDNGYLFWAVVRHPVRVSA